MASRFLLRAGALPARGHRLLAGQIVRAPPLAAAASVVALPGQGRLHYSATSRPRSSIAELDEAMRNMETRLDAIEAANNNLYQHHSSKTMPAKRSSMSWVPPEAGWVKINVDACFAEDFGEATTGVVIRDERGGVVLSATQELPAVLPELPACSSKEEARLAACRNGLALALEHCAQPTRAVLESDSAACIVALTRTCRDPSRLPAINREIMELKEGFEELRFAKIRRRQNAVARLLAVEARDWGNSVCFKGVPYHAQQQVLAESRSPTVLSSDD